MAGESGQTTEGRKTGGLTAYLDRSGAQAADFRVRTPAPEPHEAKRHPAPHHEKPRKASGLRKLIDQPPKEPLYVKPEEKISGIRKLLQDPPEVVVRPPDEKEMEQAARLTQELLHSHTPPPGEGPGAIRRAEKKMWDFTRQTANKAKDRLLDMVFYTGLKDIAGSNRPPAPDDSKPENTPAVLRSDRAPLDPGERQEKYLRRVKEEHKNRIIEKREQQWVREYKTKQADEATRQEEERQKQVAIAAEAAAGHWENVSAEISTPASATVRAEQQQRNWEAISEQIAADHPVTPDPWEEAGRRHVKKLEDSGETPYDEYKRLLRGSDTAKTAHGEAAATGTQAPVTHDPAREAASAHQQVLSPDELDELIEPLNEKDNPDSVGDSTTDLDDAIARKALEEHTEKNPPVGFGTAMWALKTLIGRRRRK